MKKSKSAFLYRVLTVVFFLVSFFLADGFLLGELSVLGLAVFFPAAVLATSYCFGFSNITTSRVPNRTSMKSRKYKRVRSVPQNATVVRMPSFPMPEFPPAA